MKHSEELLCHNLIIQNDSPKSVLQQLLRYFVPQVPITGKMLNGYLMFSVENIVQNVKLIEVWGKTL